MTSRLYSEINNTIMEEDENNPSSENVTGTPRTILIPSKRSRQSASRLPSPEQIQQGESIGQQFEKPSLGDPSSISQAEAIADAQNIPSLMDSNGADQTLPQRSVLSSPADDKVLETTFADQLSLDDTPSSSYSITTTPHNTTRKNVTFKVDKQDEVNSGKKPSFGRSPSFGKAVDVRTPRTDVTQKSVSFDMGGGSVDETREKSPFFGTPKSSTKKLPQEFENSTRQGTALFSEEGNDEFLIEQTAILPSSSEGASSSLATPKKTESDAHVLGSPMLSMEEELEICAKETCNCSRFESVIREYNTLREKLQAAPKHLPFPDGTAMDLVKAECDSQVRNEIVRLTQELEAAKMEVDACKKSTDIAKKEAADYLFVLDEEKRRAKDRIADLQKDNFALSDEVEKLKAAGTGGGSGDAMQQHPNDIMINEYQKELARLNEMHVKAMVEIEELKKNASSFTQNDIDKLEAAFAVEKETFNAQLAQSQQERESAIESFKDVLGNTTVLKEQLAEAKEKLTLFDSVVEKGYEAEIICNQLKQKNDALIKENADLISRLDSGTVPLDVSRNALDKENAQLQLQLAEMKKKLSEASLEAEDYKSQLQVVQMESDVVRKSMESRIRDIQEKADAEITTLKSDAQHHRDMAVHFRSVAASTDDEVNLLRRTSAVQEFKTKAENAQKEIDNLQAALIAQQESFGARLAEVQEEKEAEIAALKEEMGNNAVLKGEMAEMKSKLATLDEVIQKGYEAETLCNQLRAKVDAFEKENAHLNALLTAKGLETEQLKSSFNDEVIELHGEIGELKLQLSERSSEAQNITKTWMEVFELNNLLSARVAELEQLKNSADGEIGNLRAEIAELNIQLSKGSQAENSYNQLIATKDALEKEKAELTALVSAKIAEIEHLKNAADREVGNLQAQVRDLNDKLSNCITEMEEYKSVGETAKAESEKLQQLLNRGKEYMNTKLADLERRKNVELEAMGKVVAILEKEKAELFADTKAEISSLKEKIARDTAEFEDRCAKLRKIRDESIIEADKLNGKIGKLYDQLDTCDAERKELAELVFDLSSKLKKYAGNEGFNDDIRAAIDLAEFVVPRRPPSPDNSSYKSAADEELTEAFPMEEDDDINVSPTNPKPEEEEGAHPNNDESKAAEKKGNKSNISCPTQ